MSHSNVNKQALSAEANAMRAACAMPNIGIVRGLWEGNCLTEHGCPLARALGMPSGHIAYASLRGDAWIHIFGNGFHH